MENRTKVFAAERSRLAVAFPILPRDARTSEKISLRMREVLGSLVGEPWLVRFGSDEPDQLLHDAGSPIAASDRAKGGFVRYKGRHGVLIAAEPAWLNPAPAARRTSARGEEQRRAPSTRQVTTRRQLSVRGP